MTEANPEALAAVHQELTSRIRQMEVRKANAPLWEAMQKSLAFSTGPGQIEIMAPATASQRLSTIALEKSTAGFPAKLAAAEARMEGVLDALRRRTAALERLLEAVS